MYNKCVYSNIINHSSKRALINTTKLLSKID